MKVSLEKVVWTGSKSSGGELTNKQTNKHYNNFALVFSR